MIGAMLADMATSTEAARQLLWTAAEHIEAGDAHAARWASMCKLFAGDTAMAVTTDAVQVLGGYGYTTEYPVERMMRDAKITQLYEGTQQIQRLIIARDLLTSADNLRPREVRLNIVVLLKAVPVVGTERLGSDLLTDRSVQLEANGNDEYLLEKALKLTDTHGGDVTLLSVGPANATNHCARRWRWARRAACMSSTTPSAAPTRGRRSTFSPRPRASSSSTCCSPAPTPPTARVAWWAPRWRSSSACRTCRMPRRSSRPMAACASTASTTAGYDVLEAPTPAVVMGTQLLGAPRYPALRGIMQARSKPIDVWSLADLGIDAAAVGQGAATNRTLDADKPPERAGATFIREPADVAAAQIVDFLASRRLI